MTLRKYESQATTICSTFRREFCCFYYLLQLRFGLNCLNKNTLAVHPIQSNFLRFLEEKSNFKKIISFFNEVVSQ